MMVVWSLTEVRDAGGRSLRSMIVVVGARLSEHTFINLTK